MVTSSTTIGVKWVGGQRRGQRLPGFGCVERSRLGGHRLGHAGNQSHALIVATETSGSFRPV